MKNASVSLRLTFWFSSIFLGGFVLSGVIVWVDLAYSLSQGRDRTLTRRAARFIDLMEATRDDSAGRATRFAQLADLIPEGNLIQIFDHTGRRFLPLKPSPADFPWPAISSIQRRNFSNLEYDGRPYRLLQQPVQALTPFVVVVAGQLEDNHNLMARFTAGLAAAMPVLLVLSACGGYFLSRRALQPVEQIAETLRSISIGSLSRRLPISHTGDELQRLADTCNEMLARLEDAVDRINRFTADASHELRSPLALIRTAAEYALKNPDIDNDSREAFEEILAEAGETARLLEDLLTLARADAGYAKAIFEPVEVAGLIEDVCARLRPLAEGKQQTVIARTGGPAWVNGDRSSLRRLLSILLENAIKYTPANGRVEVELSTADSRAVVTVRDSGIGISEELLPRIFDRFFRADPSRGVVNGTGLGLAIAKWIAGAHDANLTVQSKPAEGSVFTVEFHLAETTGVGMTF